MKTTTAAHAKDNRRAASTRRPWSLSGILLAPVRAVGLAAAFVFEVLASINPLLWVVCLLSDE